jgi:hypothetical protein
MHMQLFPRSLPPSSCSFYLPQPHLSRFSYQISTQASNPSPIVIIVIAVQVTTQKKRKQAKDQDVDKKESRHANKVPPPAAFERNPQVYDVLCFALTFVSFRFPVIVRDWIPVVNPNACLYEDATQRNATQ